MLVGKQKLGHIPIVLECALLIHPGRDFESSLDQKPPNATNTPNEDVPREEPYDSAQSQFAEDEKGHASEEGGQGKRGKCGGNNRLRFVFSNNFGDFTCEDVAERHYFYHHPANSTCEIATAKSVHELRNDRRDEEEGYTHGTKTVENGFGGEQDHTIGDAIQNVEK
jgi:hypothetical protein